MEIFNVIGRKYVRVDPEILDQIEQTNYQKAASCKTNWYKKAQISGPSWIAAWVLSNGNIAPVPRRDIHVNYVMQNPGYFNLTKKDVNRLNASDIFDLAIENGAIRLIIIQKRPYNVLIVEGLKENIRLRTDMLIDLAIENRIAAIEPHYFDNLQGVGRMVTEGEPIDISETDMAYAFSRKWYKKAKLNNVEIELKCANAEVLGEDKAKLLYTNYLQLKKAFPDMVKLQRSKEKYVDKEPETWVNNIGDYWECSIFVPIQKLNKWKQQLEHIGFKIDAIHKDGEEINNELV